VRRARRGGRWQHRVYHDNCPPHPHATVWSTAALTTAF
jgi:hypothetical protein